MKYLLTIGCLLIVHLSYGQDDLLQQRHTLVIDQGSVEAALEQLENLSTDFSLAYSGSIFQNATARSEKKFENVPLRDIVNYILQGTKTKYRLSGNTLIIIPVKIKKGRIYGTVRDSLSGDYIPHAIISYGLHGHTRADEYGNYTISLPQGTHRLECSALGFEEVQRKVTIGKEHQQDLFLAYNNLMEEIIITDDSVRRVSNHYEHYGYKYLQHLSIHTPGLGGIHDIMHTVRSLPGIQSGSGGIGGHYVRGSSNSENLILMDGATLYYPYHSLGIASIFDPKFVSNMQVFKSGFSPKYGGRTASVVDIHIREGNKERWTANSSMSLQTADLMLDGPILDLDASLMLYGRLKSVGTSLDNIINNNLFYTDGGGSEFSDVLAKYNHTLGNHKLQFTYFRSNDMLSTTVDLSDDEESEFENELKWSNQVISAKWRSILSSSAIVSASVAHSQYDNLFQELASENVDGELESTYYYEASSANQDLTLSAHVDLYQVMGHDVKIGWSSLRQRLMPSTNYIFQDDLLDDLNDLSESSILEEEEEGLTFTPWTHALHIALHKQVGKWALDYGLRYSIFKNDDVSYKNVEPRLNMVYQLGARHAISVSAARMVQYIHLLSNSAVNLPRDIWYPSDAGLTPQSIWHKELGWQYDMKNLWSLDVRAYHKDIKGFQALNTNFFDLGEVDSFTDVLQGDGYSKGLEFNLSKKVNGLKGNIGYSLSTSRRSIENYNQGKTFAFQFDRRHEVKLVGTYQINDRFDIGLSAYAGSGHPRVLASFADLNQGIEQIDLSPLGLKNTYRSGVNYRIDLSAQYNRSVGHTSHHLKLSVYNLTNSDNPLFFLSDDVASFQEPGFSVPFLPSFHYTIQF